MNCEWSGLQTLWKTPDGSHVTEIFATLRGRIVVRTETGKTYTMPKRYMKKLRERLQPNSSEKT